MDLTFSDLEDPAFAAVGQRLSAPPKATPAGIAKAAGMTAGVVGRFTEKCPKCRGTGAFTSYTGRLVGKCFHCKGAGKLSFAQDADTRAKNRANAGARKARRADENWDLFVVDHADLAAWILANPTFEFATSCQEAVRKYGELSEGRVNGIRKCIAKNAERAAAKAAQAQAAPTAPACDASRLAESMRTAKANGLKFVFLDIAEFTFKLAPDTGKNPGAIYVTLGDKGEYLGKIMNDKFMASQAGAAIQARILEVAQDPFAAAKLHGLQTGRCSCCRRELTNPESVALGIGPICREKFGW